MYFVPNIGKNLISVSYITDNRNRIEYQNNEAKIYNSEGDIVAVAIKKNKLYELEGRSKIKKLTINYGITELNKVKWHRILGNVNVYDLSIMCKNKLLRGLPQTIEPSTSKLWILSRM